MFYRHQRVSENEKVQKQVRYYDGDLSVERRVRGNW